MLPDALKGWYVILLRPALTREALRRAVLASGAAPVLLPGLRLVAATDPDAANRDLALALQSPLVLATSPAAVHFARQLPAWRRAGNAHFAAVGSGTAKALRRAGIGQVIAPDNRQDSDGLLDLPALNAKPLSAVGLITAPGGRGRLDEVLTARGVRIHRANVYERLPARLDSRHQRALDAIQGPAALLHSSGEALSNVRAALPAASWSRLLDALVIPSSERLAAQARERGFRIGPMAESASGPDLLAALRRAAG